MITVFTPTYNRKKELKKLYKSLLNQNTNDFEWLIVDDGSTDKTDEYIDKIKKENKININYHYQPNGGKQSAYNSGLDYAKGDIFFCIDSDDILEDNVLNKIVEDFQIINEKEDVAGVMYLQRDINSKKIIGTEFPTDKEIYSYHDIYGKYHVTGDKLIVFKTKIAKDYHFPIIENEKFITEALIYNRISLKYSFLCRNLSFAYKEYLTDGYTSNYFNLVKRNPLGNRLYFMEAYSIKKSLYNIYGYILFSIYGKKSFKKIVQEHPAKLRIILLYLPVLFISKRK